MLPYKNLILINTDTTEPLYRQIAVQLIALIQEGKLLPGTLLPSTRTLAFDLQLHRKTITAAYDVLVSEDWVDNLPRKGYVVSSDLPLIKPRSYKKNKISAFAHKGVISFEPLDTILNPVFPLDKSRIMIDDGFPDVSLLPVTTIAKQFKKALDNVTYKAILRHGMWENSNLSVALSTFLKQTRGLDIGVENIFITRGAQMAIYIAASLIIKPGDKVIVSDPSYFIADLVFERLGAELIRVPVDSEGMCTQSIEEILQKNEVKMMYIIPHHHHPTTVTMSVERRQHMLKLIKAYDIAVIEDDYDYDFQFKYDPYLPLASGDHGGKIIYIGSLTKVLGTPFRLGYMVATTDFLDAARKLRRLIDIRGDAIIEEAAAGLINNGDLTRHIQRSNRLYAQRCDMASELISKELTDVVNFTKPTGGMALWLTFNPEFKLYDILKKAHKDGIVLSGTVYCTGKNAHLNSCRFGFASLNEKQLIEVIEVLKKASEK
ncbi:aminotransferase-like domain-containing protein [Chryseobacterium paridis]|uniref:PLP-dependent aminotransferase family protein n=1 Tax=Chryseobacterium paridis TaxID=2800328 RepID=A0ABS1FW42_9FLAO|nr:PLP-dependent aminotransferase family protein [Chryseobacterium paridis]MBK1896649.1 PLP-dependent aminotransferase family protein [Chryseobacterium paridis]